LQHTALELAILLRTANLTRGNVSIVAVVIAGDQDSLDESMTAATAVIHVVVGGHSSVSL
jgi:hypothetical protein